MKNNLLLLLLILFSLNSKGQNYTKIKVGAGPEDFVIDTFDLNERLIISCDERRDKDSTVFGDMYEYNFKNGKVSKLNRLNEPQNLIFNPHGIHLVRDNDSSYLFVVNHFNGNTEVLRYLVEKENLYFKEKYFYSSSFNSVMGLSKNSFIATNDKKFSGKVVMYKDEKYSTLDKCIKYPNGVNIKNNKLYISTTLSNKVYEYDINSDFTLSKPHKIAKVKGADNIRFYGDWLLTSSHYKFMKFISHYKNPKNISPSLIYAININTGEKKELFNDDGSMISAASGAIYYKGNLYIAQVFENFILKVKVDL